MAKKETAAEKKKREASEKKKTAEAMDATLNASKGQDEDKVVGTIKPPVSPEGPCEERIGLSIHQRKVMCRSELSAMLYAAFKNDFQKYDYVSSGQILADVRPKMDKWGIIIEPHLIENGVTFTPRSEIGESQHFTVVRMHYHMINMDDPKDRIVTYWEGHGWDNAEKGIGKCLTYAEKFYLARAFNIPTSKEDDPDSAEGPKTQDATKPKGNYKGGSKRNAPPAQGDPRDEPAPPSEAQPDAPNDTKQEPEKATPTTDPGNYVDKYEIVFKGGGDGSAERREKLGENTTPFRKHEGKKFKDFLEESGIADGRDLLQEMSNWCDKHKIYPEFVKAANEYACPF